MVVGFLRSSESRAQQTQQQPAHMMQAPAQTIAMHHHHLQLQSSLASSSSASAPPPSLASIRSSSSGAGGNHAVKRPFQELPRLHVPSHALAQQAQPMWKTGSVIMPSSLGLVSGGSAPPPPPAAPRFQFFTNTVGGWFGRNSAPAKTLPSFHEILARTNQLQIVGGQEDPENTQQQQQQQQQAAAADIDMLSAQTQQQEQMQQEQLHLQHMQQQQQMQQQMQHHEQQQMQMQMQQQQQTLAMQYPPNAAPPSYTAFAPQAISLQANEMLAQRPSLSVVSGTGGTGAGEAPSPVSLASPAASQTSGDASKRRERWTEDEHARFMEGLNRYGRKWKKIQTFVQTKTAVQVRTHAYGYFAKLLRNMPEDDGVWELAEEMSSLPGAVLKGPGNGKRRNEPKTDEQGMDVLRRFVFSKKKTDDKKAAQAPAGESGGSADSAIDASDSDGQQQSSESQQQQSSGNQQQQEAPYANWSIVEDSAASSAMLELKRQRIM